MGVRDGSSPNEVWENDATSATRTMKFAWTDRFKAAYSLLGYGYVEGGSLKRYLPEVHPEFPWLIATKITRTMGIGWRAKDTITKNDPNGFFGVTQAPINRFQYVQFTVFFDFTEYDIKADNEITSELDRYVVIRTTQSAKALTYPQGAIYWAAGPNATKVVIGSTGKIEPSQQLEVSWLNVPEEAVPFLTMDRYIGTINQSAFNLQGSRDARTLLLLSAQRKKVRLPYGVRAWDIVYTFKYFPPGHDTLFNFLGNQKDYFQVTTVKNGPIIPIGAQNTDGKLIYNERDFSNLFKPGA